MGNSRKIIIIEFNEFNTELLAQACGKLSLPAISWMLSLPSYSYRTEDTYDSGFLEPWVQWSSVHLGVPSSYHSIKNLGEVHTDDFQAIWEVLDEKGISSGVFGCMNAVRKSSSGNRFFLPYPWV